MKVLHITSPKTWRGGEQQLIYLAEELKVLGIEQVIMCPVQFTSAQVLPKASLPPCDLPTKGFPQIRWWHFV